MRKLRPMPRKRRLKRVDLLVIRTSRAGFLGSSKPCAHCLSLLQRGLPERGYCLETVYYSDEQGSIVGRPFRELVVDDPPHVSRFYRPDGRFVHRS